MLFRSWGPARIIGENDKVKAVELIKCDRVFDERGRFHPTFFDDQRLTVDCDTVVLAIGQATDLSWIRPGDNLNVTPRGTLEADPDTLATSRPDIFAGGDVAFGPRIIITAVAEGQRAARGIARYLTGREPAPP